MHNMATQQEYEKMKEDMMHYMVVKGFEMWSKTYDMWSQWNSMWMNMTQSYWTKFLQPKK